MTGSVRTEAAHRAPRLRVGSPADLLIVAGLGGAIGYAALQQGGFYRSQLITVVALVTVAALGRAVRWRRPVPPALAVAAGALAAFAGWAALRADDPVAAAPTVAVALTTAATPRLHVGAPRSPSTGAARGRARGRGGRRGVVLDRDRVPPAAAGAAVERAVAGRVDDHLRERDGGVPGDRDAAGDRGAAGRDRPHRSRRRAGARAGHDHEPGRRGRAGGGRGGTGRRDAAGRGAPTSRRCSRPSPRSRWPRPRSCRRCRWVRPRTRGSPPADWLPAPRCSRSAPRCGPGTSWPGSPSPVWSPPHWCCSCRRPARPRRASWRRG